MFTFIIQNYTFSLNYFKLHHLNAQICLLLLIQFFILRGNENIFHLVPSFFFIPHNISFCEEGKPLKYCSNGRRNSISLEHYQILLTEIARKTHIIDFFCHKFCRTYDAFIAFISPSIALYCLTIFFPSMTL